MTSTPTSYGATDMAEIARQARVRILEAVKHANGGHVGGPYSAADMLAALYFGIMNVRPDEPGWPDRDRFILSKGHSSIALYTMLALRGYFPVEELLTRADSKFRLVTLASMRARQINAYFGQLGEGLGSSIPPQVTSVARKPLSIAFVEIAADKIEAVDIDPEEIAAAEAAALADAEALLLAEEADSDA